MGYYKLIYNLISFIALIPYSIYYSIKSLTTKDLSILEKIGFFSKSKKLPKEAVVIYSSSLGESASIVHIIKKMTAAGLSVVVITQTKTGKQHIIDHCYGSRVYHIYAPMDNPIIVSRFFKVIKVTHILWVESELWLNFLTKAKAMKIPSMLLNARMSDRSFKRWNHLRSFVCLLYNSIDYIIAQSPQDYSKIHSFDVQNIQLLTNLKYYKHYSDIHSTKDVFNNESNCFSAFSVHSKEAEALPKIIKEIKVAVQDFKAIIILRYANITDTLINSIQEQGLSYSINIDDNSDIIVVNEYNNMSKWLSLSSIALSGKSLFAEQSGGHNIIEPIIHGNVVMSGPFMQHFKEINDALLTKGALVTTDIDNLSQDIISLMKSPEQTAKLRENAYKYTCQCINESYRDYNIVLSNFLGYKL